jgi:hypothetical protein
VVKVQPFNVLELAPPPRPEALLPVKVQLLSAPKEIPPPSWAELRLREQLLSVPL